MNFFSRYRPKILALLLLLAALLFYTVGLRVTASSSLFERAVISLTAPLQNLITSACQRTAELWTHYLWLVETASRNEQLQDENRDLRGQLAAVTEVSLENDRLRKLLNFKQEIKLRTLPARVIAEDATNWFQTVVIDKGAKHGLREGLPVVVAEGVVGRIIRVSVRESRVLLITDASSAVAAIIQHSRTRGICRGRGTNLSFEFVLRQQPIAVGDRIVTAGTGGVFPKGLPLGIASKVDVDEYGLFQQVEMVPLADFSRLEDVLVLLPEES
ncbi:MAG: rod shape-determining protein MreC [Desulfuromonadales bacterium]|nr:rod shape-determining protein MreC [Desulfuromonadales bacterium]